MTSGTCEIHWTDDSGNLECDLEIKYSYTPYRAARINCDPDDGWEAEGGIDDWNIESISSIQINGGDVGECPASSPQGKLWNDMVVDGIGKIIRQLECGPDSISKKFRATIEESIYEEIAELPTGRED